MIKDVKPLSIRHLKAAIDVMPPLARFAGISSVVILPRNSYLYVVEIEEDVSSEKTEHFK
jgi:hypothetical protein